LTFLAAPLEYFRFFAMTFSTVCPARAARKWESFRPMPETKN